MDRLSCVIFDLDGTLTQTNKLIFATFNHIAVRYLGKEYTPAEITSLFGPPEEVAIERIVGRERAKEATAEFYRFYEEHHARLAALHAGIRDLLDMLKRGGLLLAVFTGKGKRTTAITLEKIGIRQYFDMIVTGSDVKNHKPSPDGIQQVLARFQVPPQEALMVGDAVADVNAARAAGVRMAAVLWDSYGRDHVLAMDVDERFESVAELSTWFRSRLGGGSALG